MVRLAAGRLKRPRRQAEFPMRTGTAPARTGESDFTTNRRRNADLPCTERTG